VRRKQRGWIQATLVKRSFDFDVFTCRGCGGRRRGVAVLKGPGVKEVLRHLGFRQGDRDTVALLAKGEKQSRSVQIWDDASRVRLYLGLSATGEPSLLLRGSDLVSARCSASRYRETQPGTSLEPFQVPPDPTEGT
jgi:hypothetical protein